MVNLTLERSYLTPFANSPLFPLLIISLMRQRQAPNTANEFDDVYDYIIVGGGSAGSVVANRLTECPSIKVLLLEAGYKAPVVSDVPGTSRSFVGSNLDWKYRTTPQKKTAALLTNREVVWPSGRALGGSSVINAMMYVRGNRRNYDGWKEQGAFGWGYDDVLPYFKKMEDNLNMDFVDDGFHGVGGPITVMQQNYTAEIKDPLTAAVTELGYKFVDSNGAEQYGFYNFQGTLRDGQRCSAAKGYLVPAENRTNLHILPNAMVRKILIETSHRQIRPRAYGVSFDYDGETYEVRALNEVIMSAGTTNTAQLLMLSGIGPRCELSRFGIPIIKELPVGENLQDHLGPHMAYTIDDSIPKFFEKLADDKIIQQYIDYRSGPMAAAEAISYLAFLSNRMLMPNTDVPDYQLYFLEGFSELLLAQNRMKKKAFDQVYGPYANRTFYWCIPSIVHPRSRGYVGLRSDDPYDPPVIEPFYFQNKRDLEDVVEGMKTCNRIAKTKAMKAINTKAFETVYPGCENVQGNEDAYLACMARSLVLTFNHQVGTAKMGNPLDSSTVVDPQLRVIGVDGLRVVDASIMPTVPWGNTNAPTMMVAEKASDIIKRGIRCGAARKHRNDRKWLQYG